MFLGAKAEVVCNIDYLSIQLFKRRKDFIESSDLILFARALIAYFMSSSSSEVGSEHIPK